MKVSTRDIAIYRDPGVILIDQLKQIYVEGELEVVDTTIWHAKAARKDYTIGMNLTGMSVDDPDPVFYENYACKSERNYTQYCDPAVDKMIDEQSQETDVEKRKKLVWAIEKKLNDDLARPIIYHDRAATCWHPHVKGFVGPPEQHLQQLAASRTCGSTSRRAAPGRGRDCAERRRVSDATRRALTREELRGGCLPRAPLPADAADAVRDVGADLRAAARDAGQHQRHPVRSRRDW